MTLRRRGRGSMLGRMPMDDDAGAAAGLPGRGYGGVLWEPSPEVVKRARVTDYRRWLAGRGISAGEPGEPGEPSASYPNTDTAGGQPAGGGRWPAAW